MASFPPRTLLWDVLEEFGRQRSTTFTSAEDPKTSNYLQPVLSFLNREFSSNRDLRNTSLETVGLSPGSNGLLRLVMKPTDIKIADFMQMEKQSLLQEAEEREKLEQSRSAKQEQLKKDQEEVNQRAAEAKERVRQAEQEEQAKKDNMRKLYVEEAAKAERERQLREQEVQRRQQQKEQKEEQERMWRQQKMREEHERAERESLRLAEEISAGRPDKSTDEDKMDDSPVTTSTATPADADKMVVDYEAPTAARIPVYNQIPSQPLDRNPTAFAPSNAPFDSSTGTKTLPPCFSSLFFLSSYLEP